jgi:hypothetical protein
MEYVKAAPAPGVFFLFLLKASFSGLFRFFPFREGRAGELIPQERFLWGVRQPSGAAQQPPIGTCAQWHSYILTVRCCSHPEEQAVQTRQRNKSKDDRRTRAISKKPFVLLYLHFCKGLLAEGFSSCCWTSTVLPANRS